MAKSSFISSGCATTATTSYSNNGCGSFGCGDVEKQKSIVTGPTIVSDPTMVSGFAKVSGPEMCGRTMVSGRAMSLEFAKRFPEHPDIVGCKLLEQIHSAKTDDYVSTSCVVTAAVLR